MGLDGLRRMSAVQVSPLYLCRPAAALDVSLALHAPQLLRAMLAPSGLEAAAAAASTPERTSAAWPPEAQRPFVDHLRKSYDFSQLLAIEVRPRSPMAPTRYLESKVVSCLPQEGTCQEMHISHLKYKI